MLYVTQKSVFSAFRYQIFNEQRQLIAQLLLPDYPLAKNARLKSFIPENVNSVITFKLIGEVYEIAFEYLNRQWVNDIRFNLLHGGVTLATVDIVSTNSWSGESKPLIVRKSIMMTQPFEAQLKEDYVLFTLIFVL